MTAFFRLSGAGNDFLALAEPDEIPSPERIRAWCTRGSSLGADGLFVLRRESAGVRMHHFNSDGQPADLCLNGTRCAARLSAHLGWTQDRVSVLTDSGPVEARVLNEQRVALDVAPPTNPEERTVGTGSHQWMGWWVRVGVPHFVLIWDNDLANAPVLELGAALRHHTDFGAEGTNVDFVRFPDAAGHARYKMEIRSYERGVEAETLACGTGVLAAAAVGIAIGQATLPLQAQTQGGFQLQVDGEAENGRIRTWNLAGDARLIAHGELRSAAAQVPDGPVWH